MCASPCTLQYIVPNKSNDRNIPTRRPPEIRRCDLRTVIVHIATGSNLGARIDHLDRADVELSALGGVLRISPTYETAAVGMAPGTPPFLNRVVEMEIDGDRWTPAQLMEALLDIERRMGRTRASGLVTSRSIDLDIVLWGIQELDLPTLTVPHPRMLERRFVLQPLCDLVPDQAIPGTGGRTVSQLLTALPEEVPQIAAWPQQAAFPTATS